jgi:transcriptional regulator with XRE-family HTH domain
MEDKNLSLRKLLSKNIKSQREKLGLTQEKLAEKAGISAGMMNDIEGCRTWISEKTLIMLSSALEVEPFRLLMPDDISKDDISHAFFKETAQELKK